MSHTHGNKPAPGDGAEPVVTRELALKHGLTPEEFERILAILGRTPTYTELGIYSVMWSEHCSYKNSIAVLKTLPREGGSLLVGAGEENAGLVDIGGGLAVAFKIESHNHPSAVEPYQGAATGVGGIMRDIFTMGARPVAGLNSLRFGDISSARTRALFRGVVKGIGDYGNSFGVPTVAGEVYFDPCYQDNPLVNAMAVGVVRVGEWASAVARGRGNAVMIVGSSTGRDGIHGATFASEEISEASEAKRPSVQVGDPFTEKLLLEASLEAIRAGLVVGIQDMGAAGITCSTSEMSAKGKSGMRIDLDLVPAREEGMSAYEIMLSESQERMLLVVEPGKTAAVREIFSKWDIHAETIGEVTETGRLEISYRGKAVADIPAETLVLGGGAPVYIREAAEPAYLAGTRAFDAGSLPLPASPGDVLKQLMGTPDIASKRWVYEQYDSMVRTNNIVLSEGDAAVVLLKESHKGLALKTDCNGRYVYLNPRLGGKIAVAESARNVACTGARPLAITNCLNFGNPYKPEVYWQFKEAVAGIGEACRYFNTPVTGGNVSFYNESPNASVFPTPVIGMLGLIDDAAAAVTSRFRDAGDVIIELGVNKGHVGGSEYLAVVHGITAGDAPPLDLAREKRLHEVLIESSASGLLQSAHDCSEGGIAVALAESCIGDGRNPIGAEVDIVADGLRWDFLLFGEDQSRAIVSASAGNGHSVLEIAKKHGVEAAVIGRVGGMRLLIGDVIDVPVAEVGRLYTESIGNSMERVEAGMY
ncbi:MAG TPA: phosphoribosylformylglycinamidine synthase subunit PurL [Bacteroidota bacterium]|nr:phosphoribosylformylglycinamidine synthase subunit PurL [Bacteroidota bacterium]